MARWAEASPPLGPAAGLTSAVGERPGADSTLRFLPDGTDTEIGPWKPSPARKGRSFPAISPALGSRLLLVLLPEDPESRQSVLRVGNVSKSSLGALSLCHLSCPCPPRARPLTPTLLSPFPAASQERAWTPCSEGPQASLGGLSGPMADRRLRASRREEGVEGRWRRTGRWHQARSVRRAPAHSPPEGLSGAVASLFPPGVQASLCPSPLGPNPSPAPISRASPKDQALSLRGAGGGWGRDFEPSSQFWKPRLYQVPNARPLKKSTPKCSFSNNGRLKSSYLSNQSLRTESPSGQEEFGWEIVMLNGSVFAGDTRCGRGGSGPVSPSAGLRDKEGRVLLLSVLRGPHVTDEMMDLKALVKCQLRTLHVRRCGYYYCCCCYY